MDLLLSARRPVAAFAAASGTGAVDAMLLAGVFVERLNRQWGRRAQGPACWTTERVVNAQSWPGNVRELENLIERAVILSKGPSIELTDINRRDRLGQRSLGPRTVQCRQGSRRRSIRAGLHGRAAGQARTQTSAWPRASRARIAATLAGWSGSTASTAPTFCAVAMPADRGWPSRENRPAIGWVISPHPDAREARRQAAARSGIPTPKCRGSPAATPCIIRRLPSSRALASVVPLPLTWSARLPFEATSPSGAREHHCRGDSPLPPGSPRRCR